MSVSNKVDLLVDQKDEIERIVSKRKKRLAALKTHRIARNHESLKSLAKEGSYSSISSTESKKSGKYYISLKNEV
jgi:hypothetical protein